MPFQKLVYEPELIGGREDEGEGWLVNLPADNRTVEISRRAASMPGEEGIHMLKEQGRWLVKALFGVFDNLYSVTVNSYISHKLGFETCTGGCVELKGSFTPEEITHVIIIFDIMENLTIEGLREMSLEKLLMQINGTWD